MITRWVRVMGSGEPRREEVSDEVHRRSAASIRIAGWGTHSHVSGNPLRATYADPVIIFKAELMLLGSPGLRSFP
jgi:hypothetical protein